LTTHCGSAFDSAFSSAFGSAFDSAFGSAFDSVFDCVHESVISVKSGRGNHKGGNPLSDKLTHHDYNSTTKGPTRLKPQSIESPQQAHFNKANFRGFSHVI
jgi:hypothetical protein